MGTLFWIKRFFVVFAGAFVVICAAQLLKGHDLSYAATQAGLWGAIAAAVFTVARLYQSRQGQHCAVCNDIPEVQPARPPDEET